MLTLNNTRFQVHNGNDEQIYYTTVKEHGFLNSKKRTSVGIKITITFISALFLSQISALKLTVFELKLIVKSLRLSIKFSYFHSCTSHWHSCRSKTSIDEYKDNKMSCGWIQCWQDSSYQGNCPGLLRYAQPVFIRSNFVSIFYHFRLALTLWALATLQSTFGDGLNERRNVRGKISFVLVNTWFVLLSYIVFLWSQTEGKMHLYKHRKNSKIIRSRICPYFLLKSV